MSCARCKVQLEQAKAEAAAAIEAAARVVEDSCSDEMNLSAVSCSLLRIHAERIRALPLGPVAREYRERLADAEEKRERAEIKLDEANGPCGGCGFETFAPVNFVDGELFCGGCFDKPVIADLRTRLAQAEERAEQARVPK